MNILLEKFSKSMLKRNMGLPFIIPISQSDRNTILRSFMKTKQGYASSLSHNMNEFIKGKITREDYLKKQKDAIRLSFTNAFSQGKRFGTGDSGKLDDKEKRFIAYQIGKEMQFMTKFADDIVSKSGSMPYHRRLEMYSDGLDSFFGFGRLVYLPEDIQIYWKLGPVDRHCIDCLLFAAQGPYSKKTLPGFPKSGNSRCLSNCRCRLVYVHPLNANTSDYESYIIDNYANGKNVPTEDEFLEILGYQDEYYFNRLQYASTRDKKFQSASKEALIGLIAFQRRNKLKVTSTLPIAGSLGDLMKIKKTAKFTQLSTISSVDIDSTIAFFIRGEMKYGKVKSVLSGSISVMTLEKIIYNIDPSRFVAFVED